MSMKMSKNNGFTLLEVMIAVFVLGIGLLGLAHLQTTSLKHNESAYLRTQASSLASDIFDRMRANQTAAKAGNYNLSVADDAPVSPSTMADMDISEWLSNMTVFLPGSDGAINCNDSDATDSFSCSEGSIFTVTVEWSEVQQDGGRGISSFIYSGAL